MTDILYALGGFIAGGSIGALVMALFAASASDHIAAARHELGTALATVLHTLENGTKADFGKAVEDARAVLKRYGWRR